jgi:hypothetical protein
MANTLKSICEQCTHLHNLHLKFIPDKLKREKAIIQRDLKELVSAATIEQQKTVIVLAGGLFESVLYCFIQAQTMNIVARDDSFTFNPELHLNNYAKVFNLRFPNLPAIPDVIIDYRNMVHINRELKQPEDICRTAAQEMLKFLDALLGSLSEYANE